MTKCKRKVPYGAYVTVRCFEKLIDLFTTSSFRRKMFYWVSSFTLHDSNNFYVLSKQAIFGKSYAEQVLQRLTRVFFKFTSTVLRNSFMRNCKQEVKKYRIDRQAADGYNVKNMRSLFSHNQHLYTSGLWRIIL